MCAQDTLRYMMAKVARKQAKCTAVVPGRLPRYHTKIERMDYRAVRASMVRACQAGAHA